MQLFSLPEGQLLDKMLNEIGGRLRVRRSGHKLLPCSVMWWGVGVGVVLFGVRWVAEGIARCEMGDYSGFNCQLPSTSFRLWGAHEWEG